jgi:L-gulonate 3-dehydrogenase
MDKIAIVGAGLIGRAWAIVFARAGYPVALYDADRKALQENVPVIDASLGDLRNAGLLDEPASKVRARIRVAGTLDDALDGAAYVQENIRETLEAKREIFGRMDTVALPETILASSTSTIPASEITRGLAGRKRCLVAHPVNPPHLVPLVELAPAPWTSPDVVARARALLENAGQVPITVKKEVQGFILNRLQAALLGEAMRLYEDGYASAEDIDKCVRNGLGLRWSFMGPFETIDLNAPGGVADYAARYGLLMTELNRTQVARPWSEKLIKTLEAERRQSQPADTLADRQAWRDRRLMALLAHLRALKLDPRLRGDDGE